MTAISLKTDNVITVSYNATSYENPFPGINITGAENDTLPVGIIIPDGVKWLAIDKTSENTSPNYTVTVNVVAKNIERASEAYEGKQYDKSIPPYTPAPGNHPYPCHQHGREKHTPRVSGSTRLDIFPTQSY